MEKNLYTIEFDLEGTASIINVRAKNKIEAITSAMEKVRAWRDKDRITNIKIIEDAGNRELTAEDYK